MHFNISSHICFCYVYALNNNVSIAEKLIHFTRMSSIINKLVFFQNFNSFINNKLRLQPFQIIHISRRNKEDYGLDPTQFSLNAVICHVGIQIEKSEKKSEERVK